MKKIETPVGNKQGQTPWPPEGTLILLNQATFRDGTFVLGVVRYGGKPQGICLRAWDGAWQNHFITSGDLIGENITEVFILEEGDELYDEASRRYMLAHLMGEM